MEKNSTSDKEKGHFLETCYSFLLVGITGSGKSAVGNSLIGSNSFLSSSSSISVTEDVVCKTATRYGTKISVVDSPGVLDTKVDPDQAKRKSLDEMKKAMSVCPAAGKMALILVLQYGSRFTEQNRLAITILKNIFGEQSLWRSCVVVVTHGDCFHSKYQGSKDFKDWTAEQTGGLGEVFENCGNTCVLFDNDTDDSQHNEKQFRELVACVERLDQSYTKIKFNEAKKSQNRIALEAELPKLKEEFMAELNGINNEIDLLAISSQSLDKIEDLKFRLSSTQVHIDNQDNPDVIFYKDGEVRLLQDVREQGFHVLSRLHHVRKEIKQLRKEDIVCSKFVKLINRLDQINPRVQSDEFFQIKERFKELSENEKLLNEPCTGRVRAWKSLAEEKLEHLGREIDRIYKVRPIQEKIDQLRDEFSEVKVPTLVSKFYLLHQTSDQIITTITTTSLDDRDRENLLQQTSVLKTKIENLKIENDMWIGWNTTNGILAALTIATTPVPIVSLGIAGVGALASIGQAIHRSVERHRRNSC